MIKITQLYVFALFCLMSFTANALELSKESVEELIAKSDKAAETQDVSVIADLLSDDIEITMNIDMKGQKHNMKTNKQEYIAMLKQGWEAQSNYKYTKLSSDIKIEGSKAFVYATAKESMTIQGQNISVETEEESIVEVVGDKLLVTKIVANAKM